MCFSASASFIAGTAVLAIGAITVRKAGQKTELPFAMIPLLFGTQQVIEGAIWLTFRFDAPLLNTVMTYIYSLFSHVLWPVYVPFSVLLLEPTPWRKRILSAFVLIGAGVGVFLLSVLVRFPITSQAVDGHIVYVSPHFYAAVVMASYLAGTCMSMFFSSHRVVVTFGVVALLSFILAYAVYTTALISVWCFFAAILSALVYLHFRHKEHEMGLLSRENRMKKCNGGVDAQSNG